MNTQNAQEFTATLVERINIAAEERILRIPEVISKKQAKKILKDDNTIRSGSVEYYGSTDQIVVNPEYTDKQITNVVIDALRKCQFPQEATVGEIKKEDQTYNSIQTKEYFRELGQFFIETPIAILKNNLNMIEKLYKTKNSLYAKISRQFSEEEENLLTTSIQAKMATIAASNELPTSYVKELFTEGSKIEALRINPIREKYYATKTTKEELAIMKNIIEIGSKNLKNINKIYYNPKAGFIIPRKKPDADEVYARMMAKRVDYKLH